MKNHEMYRLELRLVDLHKQYLLSASSNYTMARHVSLIRILAGYSITKVKIGLVGSQQGRLRSCIWTQLFAFKRPFKCDHQAFVFAFASLILIPFCGSLTYELSVDSVTKYLKLY